MSSNRICDVRIRNLDPSTDPRQHHYIALCDAMMPWMRTTVTLDPDIAARLDQLAAERGTSFKATINATLRAGLEADATVARPYREVTSELGIQPGVDLTKASSLAAELEDDETIRKLELRK